MSVSPLDVAVIAAALAAGAAFARWRAGGFRMPRRRVLYDDPARQIEADFPAAHRAEAAALLDGILAHAAPDDRATVARSVLSGVRGDVAKLRRASGKSAEALDRIYRLLGGAPAGPKS